MSWEVNRKHDRRHHLIKKQSVLTVRNFFSAGLVTLLLTVTGLVANVNTVPKNSTLSLETNSETVKIGERFFVDVIIEASVPINAVSIEIEHSPNVVIDSLRDGESVLNIWTEPPSVKNRLITLSGGSYRRGFSGKHRIISIQARARDAGNASFTIRSANAVAGDGEGTQITLSKTQKTLSLNVHAEELTTENLRELKTDLTGNGRVTLQDISIFMVAWNNKDKVYDFTGDGRMTFRDFSIILSDFFQSR